MLRNIVYVVKVYNADSSVTYVGKDNTITDPWSYQLFEFAKQFGFDTKDDAINYPMSFWRDGNAVSAIIIPLEVW